MPDSYLIAQALRRLATDDQDPPKPWAYLSDIGIEWVSRVRGTVPGTARSSFTLTADGQSFAVIVQKTDDSD